MYFLLKRIDLDIHTSVLGHCVEEIIESIRESSGQANREPEHRRVYDYIFDTHRLASRDSHRRSSSALSAFYASMCRCRTINTILGKPVRQSADSSVSFATGQRNLSLIRIPCFSPAKPMARSSRPESLKASVRNGISGSGCAIRLTRKAKSRSKIPLDS